MKTKVALITGGYTGEAEVSLKSSAFVHSQLNQDTYEIYPIVISRNGWYYDTETGTRILIDKEDFSLTIDGQKVIFQIAFITLHGTPGEDGRIQGYFDMIGLPYTSSGALTSALTMNKGYTKAIVAGIENLFVANSVLLFASDRGRGVEKIRSTLKLPYFVKPNAGGSSIGMSKVNEVGALQHALDMAFDAEDTGAQVIVEEFVQGREFSQGIYRNAVGELVVLPATEVRTTREFFDFEAKYTPGLSEEITPADLNEEQIARASAIIRDIYVRLNCAGMVRVDFFLEKDTDKFYFIEINTIPGQTPQSFIPQQIRAYGMKETDFYSELIESALQRRP
ncbi:MAG: D-alanine--D-alanine ligase family protein [Sphingobacterium sp.]